MNRFLLFFSLVCLTPALGQIGMHDWRIHFSSLKVVGIAESGTNIYMACSNGIVDYDTDDNSIELLTITNGLSDLGISSIASSGSVVTVGYANGNLDIIEGNTITNIPWIEKAEISGDKEINSVFFDGNLIYVACNIGLVVIDQR